jgi:hypothetical protein
VLEHRHRIREELGRVELVGQPVVDGHVGEIDELVDDGLPGPAVFDGVVEASQDARRVAHRLLVANLRLMGTQERDVCALVVRGDLEGAARARGGLLEDEGDVLADEPLALVTAVLRRLQLAREPQQKLDVARGEVEQVGEVAAAQVNGHQGCPPFL